MAHSQAAHLNNGIWIPGWWVRAYDSLCTCSSLSGPMDIAMASKVFPACTLNELKSLSIVLSKLQQRVIECGEELQLGGEDKKRRYGPKGRGGAFDLERAMQDAISLKLLVKKCSGANEEYESVPIFDREICVKKGGKDEVVVVPRLAELGGEILIGYGEPYSDLVRVATKRVSIKDVLGDMPPLSLWRSVWLDLQGSELSSFLGLEKAMQWEKRHLTFDGAFGCAAHEILDKLVMGTGVKRENRGGGETKFGLKERILHLERFGKKLLDHGVIGYDEGDKYFAFGQSGLNQMEIVWESSAHRYLDEENGERLAKFTRYLHKKVFKLNRGDVVRLMLAGGPCVESEREIVGIWQDIEEKFSLDVSQMVSIVSGNMLIMAGPLFLEWCLRGSKMTRFALSDDIDNVMKPFLCRCGSVGEVADKFAKFLLYGEENGKVVAELLCQKMSTIVDPSVRGGIDLENGGVKAVPVGHAAILKDVAKNVEKSVVGGAEKNIGEKKSEGNLKRQVSDELMRIKERQPERYKVIKQTYLDALDQQSRRIINEVQKRLQPHVFDQQLKNSLVKFLIDNPGVFSEHSVRPQS